MSFFRSYPSVPDDLLSSDYCIYYNTLNDSYTLFTYNSSYSSSHHIYGYVHYLFGSTPYKVVNGSWVSSGSSLPFIDFRYNTLVYSSSNVYDLYDKNHYFISAGEDSNVVFCNTVSSTTIISDLFRVYLPVVSVVVTACVLFIGFRKAWSFVINSVRGA